MKSRFRALLSLVLTLTATLLVACGGTPTAAAPPTYTATQLDRIQDYRQNILERHERMAQIPGAIQTQNPENVTVITRGPLGQMLMDMQNLNRNLLPKEQPTARETSRALFDDLVAVEQAMDVANYSLATRSYDAAEQDFQRYLQLLPPEPTASSPSVEGDA
jgi:photosystem II protein PsbQ